jgi:flagellar basal body-associated protein FliL
MEPKRKKAVFSILGLLIIILAIGLIMYFSLAREGESIEKASQNKEKDYKLDVSILESNFFDNLTHYAIFPLRPGRSGRKNPFEPYQ